MAAAPRTAAIPEGTDNYGRWRLVGHFDDPVARTCRVSEPGEWGGREPPSPEEVVHWCRTTFLLSTLKRIGEAEP